MQAILVAFTLVLYAVFAFNPIMELPVFSKTLNISPGDLFTILFVFGLFLKMFVQQPNKIIIRRPPAVIRFLYAYSFLAVVFLISTLTFFLFHNEFAPYLGRSLFNYLLWSIALVLFYYGSDSQPKIKELRLINWLLMGAFFLGVVVNIVIDTPGSDLLKLINDMLQSNQTRLAGQVDDPNQLGALAAFFSVIGIMGVLQEKHRGAQMLYAVLTVGIILVLLVTQSREAMLTLFISTLCIGISLLRAGQYRKAFIVLLGLFLSSALILANVSRVAETLTAVAAGDTGYALSDREEVWRIALQTISTNPLGIGFENMFLINNTISQAHNAFFQSALIAGLAGFIAFVWFIICLLKLLREQKRLVAGNWLLEAYFVFLVGYLATSFGSDHFISFYTFNAIFFGFLGLVTCAR